jgi:uncharacterized MAPEG superfamily protein
MTTDLWMLVWSGLLCVLMPFAYVLGLGQVQDGFAWGFGNRERPLELPPWAARAKRAHMNMIENLAPFAILVLTAHVAGKANATTALGATIFFWARVVYFLVYTAGIPYLRTAVFALAGLGEVMILLQLFN